jgi:hypothetical protein
MKPINRDEIAQDCVASLKDAEDPEIDRLMNQRNSELGSYSSARAADSAQSVAAKRREWSQELQLKESVHG